MVTLPPLAALRAFEATVRLGGLARAAVELNLTISAISHQSHTRRRETIVRRRQRPVAAGGRHDWHRYGQTITVEVLEELDRPREISVAPGTETTDRELPVDARAPQVIGDSARVVRCELRLHPTARCLPSAPFGRPTNKSRQSSRSSWSLMKPMNVAGSKFRLPESWSSHIRSGSSRSASVGRSNGMCATTRKGLPGTRLQVHITWRSTDASAEHLVVSRCRHVDGAPTLEALQLPSCVADKESFGVERA